MLAGLRQHHIARGCARRPPDPGSPTVDRGGYPFGLWWYAIAAGLVGFGFADFSLLAYHFSQAQTVAPTWIPLF
jgi:hypothetical protein